MSAARWMHDLLAAMPAQAILGAAIALASINNVATALARTHAQVTRCIDGSQLLFLALGVFLVLRSAPLLDDWSQKAIWCYCVLSLALKVYLTARRRNGHYYRIAITIKQDFVFFLLISGILQWLGDARQRYGEVLSFIAFACIMTWYLAAFLLLDKAVQQWQDGTATTNWSSDKQEDAMRTVELPPKRLAYITSVHVIILAGLQLFLLLYT